MHEYGCVDRATHGMRHERAQIAGGAESFVPRFGSRYSGGVLPAPAKSNRFMMLPALASNEPPPRRWPPSQLSSMKRTTEACVIGVSSTKLTLAHGDTTINGVRVPGPQRPFTAPPFTPCGCTAPA